MPKVKTRKGELDSIFKVTTEDGVFGLVLESWGPSTRNPDYAIAFEHILENLKNGNVPFIHVYVASKDLASAYPHIDDRAVLINGSSMINLMGKEPSKLRLEIGKQVRELKVTPSTASKGGNSYKRILIHSPLMTEADWIAAASAEGNIQCYEPTSDAEKLERTVTQLQGLDLPIPHGIVQPKKNSTTVTTFFRSPQVKAWVLKEAGGICEMCCQPAPFMRDDGSPYLEVHHLLPLAEGGSDSIDNTIALCPNCHRRLHFGVGSFELKSELIGRIKRLSWHEKSTTE